jgi:hypothetical protein
MIGVDFAWAHPSIDALHAVGATFVCRYLSRDPTKNLTAAEASRLHKAGIATVSNWEAEAGAARNGFGQGVRDAKDADAQHKACGGTPDRPIYFSVDFDTRGADPAPVAAYFRGVASIIGVGRCGAYGGYNTIRYLFDAGLIRWGWQTFAWSAGQWDARAQLRQVRNGVSVGGVDSDMNEAHAVDFGQWPAPTGRGADMTPQEFLAIIIPGTSTPDHPGDRSVLEILHDVAQRRAVDWGQFDPGKVPASSPLAKLIALANNPPAAGGVSQEALNAAVLAALKDPTVAAGIGGAVAGHFHID